MKYTSGDASVDHQTDTETIAIRVPNRWLRALGWFGLLLAAPFFLWLPLALITPLPSMIDVFGVVGMRIPASFTVAGLLLAAVGFHRF